MFRRRFIAKASLYALALVGGLQDPRLAHGEPTSEVDTSSAAPPVLEIGLGAGLQFALNYDVEAEGKPTLLGYRLEGLFAVEATVKTHILASPFFAEASASLLRIRFRLDTSPPTTPSDPTGTLWRIFLGGGYHLPLNAAARSAFGERRNAPGAMWIEPLLGVSLHLDMVDAQTPAVVLSSSKLAPELGLRVAASPLLGFEVGSEGHVALSVAYSESPAKTGDAEIGLGLALSLFARYWLVREFGIGASVAYGTANIGMSGAGNRPRFSGDPEIVDATIVRSDLRASFLALFSY